MNVLVVKKGISVIFNDHPGQVDNETIIALDSAKRYINNFSFKNIQYDEIQLNEILNGINETTTSEVENGFLFYSFKYQISYQHFMSSTLPLIKTFLERYPTYNLLVPEHYYNVLHEEIFNLFSINKDQIIFLKDKQMYKIKNLAERNWNINAFEIDDTRLSVYNHIRTKLDIKNSELKQKKIYIQRDTIENEKFNNSNTGKYRKIINESQLIEILKSLGFEIVTLGDKTLREKRDILEGAKIVITALGANCFNFILASCPENIYLLSNSSRLGLEYYSNLIKIFNNESNVRTFIYPNILEECDPTNQWNSPFNVNIKEILDTLEKDI